MTESSGAQEPGRNDELWRSRESGEPPSRSLPTPEETPAPSGPSGSSEPSGWSPHTGRPTDAQWAPERSTGSTAPGVAWSSSHGELAGQADAPGRVGPGEPAAVVEPLMPAPLLWSDAHPGTDAAAGGLGGAAPPGSSYGYGAFPAERPPLARVGVRTWLALVLAAALVSGLVGAGVAAFVASRSQQTIVERFRPSQTISAQPTDIQGILQNVLPAVVSVQTTGFQSGGGGLPFGGGSVGGFVQGAGTGMILTPGGEVLTNNHVVAGATSVNVTLYGQTNTHPATVLGTDPASDLALLQIQGVHNLPVVTFGNSSHLVLGDGLVAIGNALALDPGSPSVTTGIVSGLGRSFSATLPSGYTEHIGNAIQTDAPINPGNSGGPLVDARGHVVGVDTAVAASSGNNAPAQNVGFAIPINGVKPLIAHLRAGGSAPVTNSAFLGVSVVTVSPQVQVQFKLRVGSGALVTQVVPGSAAKTAGIVAGDVITALDATTVTSAATLRTAVQSHHSGQVVTITVVTVAGTKIVHATLGTAAIGVQ